ncbi:malate synthase G [Brumicola nitratireducens]|uniref:Malate synthase G n=1 Tax=Glaciecola nitratireducens (strain JCM 12485 / KCTC 12276 / FR1064) TaxID=1085623 RepID=G4QK05_GLANF|nr:malate synthase G [Glaciecola nitratireducens]AEP29127.1 malate synthase G [Glaciecola nitratireducens FR1064]
MSTVSTKTTSSPGANGISASAERYVTKGKLSVASELLNFIESSALPNSQTDALAFWQGFEKVLESLMPLNKALLNERETLQKQIDDFHRVDANAPANEYKSFLSTIGYLQAPPIPKSIETQNVDAEIATMAGPQLVVPINNARYALNAVNARWGSLYDALYGTDVISDEGGAEAKGAYNPARGNKVILKAREYLDTIAPLNVGSHVGSQDYQLRDAGLSITLADGSETTLQDPSQLIGFQGEIESPTAILVSHNGLHAEIQFDNSHPIGKTDPAGMKDIVLEAAITTIMDCEDSVAAVDAEDKTLVYQNWLGLMQGNLRIQLDKGDKTFTRSMNPDREYRSLQNEKITLSGRSLMFIRNVGHLMTNSAILFEGEEIPEGIMDAMITSLIAKHDLLNNSPFKNAKENSIYIVKPKMHGPDEVAFTNRLFSSVEQVLGLAKNTIKIGIMDEERRTSLNLGACIQAANERVVFINTGFLDRTGDEIHTSMLKGAFAPKAEIKTRPWLNAYELANVATGLNFGLSGRAQIGKGMWPIPDQMANMMAVKIGHPKTGANTAWVPSPTAATLHALHYHQIDVFEQQRNILSDNKNAHLDYIDTILEIPLMEKGAKLSPQEVTNELDNNVQGILGYVVRWVHQGIGCSKVPDINGVGLMEDRATLRISSQHIANWLEHGLVTAEQVNESLQRMAALVDSQNESDAEYIPMLPDLANSIGFQAAKDLIFLGKEQPSGYTEPLLHARRREMKAKLKDAAS